MFFVLLKSCKDIIIKLTIKTAMKMRKTIPNNQEDKKSYSNEYKWHTTFSMTKKNVLKK